MKKTILALAAAGLAWFAADAAAAEPGASPPPAATPPDSATPAPTHFEPKTMYGDVARVLSSRPVYERAPHARRECRMEGSGYSSAAGEIPRCEEVGDARERIVAYDVTYQYMGREFRVRMPYDPGEQVAVNVDVRPPGPEPRASYRIPRYRGPY